MTSFLDADRRESGLSIPGMGRIIWRPTEVDLSIWRMLCLRPDREVFATIDLARATLLSFDVEWDDPDDRRHFVTWSSRSGFSTGRTDSERTLIEGGDEMAAADPKILERALVMVATAGIDSPVATWMMDRLSAALALH